MRSVEKRHGDSGPEEGSKTEAKQFTVAVKKAPTPKNLIETLDWVVDGRIFDFILASAAYTRLAYFSKRRDGLQQSDWDSPVLLRLHAKVEDMVLQDELGARQTANVLWSIAHLSDRFRVPTELLDALVKSVPTMANGMNVQDLSNILWACAKLKDVAPKVLKAVPEIAAQIPNKAKDMIPQHLSNCLWASAQLKDLVPDVLQGVPAIAAQIPGKAKDMIPQHLSNCLLAARQLEGDMAQVLEIVPAIVGEIPVQIQGMTTQQLSNSLEALLLLRDSVPKVAGFSAADVKMDDIVRSAAQRLNKLLPQVIGKDLSFTAPVVVWACAKAEVFHPELLASVAQRLGFPKQISALPNFGVGALLWSYRVLDAEDEFGEFRQLLRKESKSSKRRLSEADVQSCELGRFRWNRA